MADKDTGVGNVIGLVRPVSRQCGYCRGSSLEYRETGVQSMGASWAMSNYGHIVVFHVLGSIEK